MNKIQKWLMHKLGGFTKVPVSGLNIVQEPYKIEPIYVAQHLSRYEYEHYFDLIFKDVIAERIAEELLKNNLIDIRKFNTKDGNIEVRAKVYVVRGGLN